MTMVRRIGSPIAARIAGGVVADPIHDLLLPIALAGCLAALPWASIAAAATPNLGACVSAGYG